MNCTNTGAALHNDALVIDLHNDSITTHILRRLGFFKSDDAVGDLPSTIRQLRGTRFHLDSTANKPVQINFSKMHDGGLDVSFFAIDVTIQNKNRLTYALDGFGYLLNDMDRHADEVVLVRRYSDIKRAKEEGRPAVVLAVEHADCVENSLYTLRSLYEVGVRSIGLTHNVSSRAADGCLEAREGVGLTNFGKELVTEMNRLGMVVDLAHVSPGGFYSALETVSKPVIFSHGNARALCEHPRNLDDDQLRALRDNGGVIGLSCVPYFVDTEKPDFERLLDHFEHVCDVAGVETVALGSDFEGGGTLLKDATEVPRITEGLLGRGFSESDVRKILGENTMRVLKKVMWG